jgi:hypothetical protein
MGGLTDYQKNNAAPNAEQSKLSPDETLFTALHHEHPEQ